MKKVCPLSSSSKGNVIYVEGEETILILNYEKKYSPYTCHKKYKKLIVILLTTLVSYWNVLLYSKRKITESNAKTVRVVIYLFFFVIFYYLYFLSCLQMILSYVRYVNGMERTRTRQNP